MKSMHGTAISSGRILLLIAALLIPNALFGQTPMKQIFTISHVLVASDFAIRTADGIVTHRQLADPCHCYKETDPLAPASGAYGPEAAFQYGQAAALALSEHITERSSHRWLRIAGRVAVAVDVGMEVRDVVGNLNLRPGVPPVTGGRLPSRGYTPNRKAKS
jgi:hypothetical protein